MSSSETEQTHTHAHTHTMIYVCLSSMSAFIVTLLPKNAKVEELFPLRRVADKHYKQRLRFRSSLFKQKSTVSKEVSNPRTIGRFDRLRKVYLSHTYLVNVVHAGEHVEISVKFVQHPHDVHGYNFVVRAQRSKTNNVTE